MTRLKITLAAAALSMTYVPVANAYEVEPTAFTPDRTAEMVVPASQKDTLDGACSLPIASVLATILALPDGIYAETNARSETSMACAEQ